MKIVSCGKCKTKFDLQYKVCPNCGTLYIDKPKKTKKISFEMITVAVAWLAIGLVFISVAFSVMVGYSWKMQDKPIENTENESNTIDKKTDETIPTIVKGNSIISGACYSKEIKYGGIVSSVHSEEKDSFEVILSMGASEELSKDFRYWNYASAKDKINEMYGDNYFEFDELKRYNKELAEGMIWEITQSDEDPHKLKVQVITHSQAEGESELLDKDIQERFITQLSENNLSELEEQDYAENVFKEKNVAQVVYWAYLHNFSAEMHQSQQEEGISDSTDTVDESDLKYVCITSEVFSEDMQENTVLQLDEITGEITVAAKKIIIPALCIGEKIEDVKQQLLNYGIAEENIVCIADISRVAGANRVNGIYPVNSQELMLAKDSGYKVLLYYYPKNTEVE